METRNTSRVLEKIATICILLSSIVYFVKAFFTTLSRLKAISKWLQKKFGPNKSSKEFVLSAPEGDYSDLENIRQEPGDSFSSRLDEEMLPSTLQPQQPSQVYTARGDEQTLQGIAQQQNVPHEIIMQYNPALPATGQLPAGAKGLVPNDTITQTQKHINKQEDALDWTL